VTVFWFKQALFVSGYSFLIQIPLIQRLSPGPPLGRYTSPMGIFGLNNGCRLAVVLLGFSLVAPAMAMPFADARHLLLRSGFGGDGGEIRALNDVSFESAVDRLLVDTHQVAVTPPPVWVNEAPPPHGYRRRMSESERKAFGKKLRQRSIELQAWWFQEMVNTPSPLTERMTLFWANHFTSSSRKVRWTPLMYQQNVLLRRHALGNFATLLRAMIRDPAMLVYLDNAKNRRGHGNENFARELLELFSLGEGHYGEADIKAAARALTGYTVNRSNGKFRFAQPAHDTGSKTFLGRMGNLDGDDIVDTILKQPQVAELITRKLWREFVSLTPDNNEIARLANLFRDHHYEIKPLLRAIFLSRGFRDPHNRAALIKSPVDLIVSTVRGLNMKFDNYRLLARASHRMGQTLFVPPNVKGWSGGKTWIDSNTLLVRQEFLRRAALGMQRGSNKMDRRYGMDADKMDMARLPQVLLAGAPTQNMGEGGQSNRLEKILLDPVYQLK